jgi:hypothetical protein
MPIFYFHVQSPDGEITKDDEGIELDDVAAARDEALHAARDLLADAASRGLDVRKKSFVVTNAEGEQIASLDFGEALQEPSASK